jgi:hypothetical protein
MLYTKRVGASNGLICAIDPNFKIVFCPNQAKRDLDIHPCDAEVTAPIGFLFKGIRRGAF